MEKVLQFKVDAFGNLIESNFDRIVARDRHVNIIQVITPLPIDTLIYANIDVRQSLSRTRTVLIRYKETVDGLHVFESEINPEIIQHINRNRAMPIGLSLSFSNRAVPALATNYLRDFNLDNPLPNSANDGDYLIADGGMVDNTFYYEFEDKGINWLKGDFAFWFDGKWRRGNYRLVANMSSVDIPVEGSVETLEYEEDNDPLTIVLAEDLANTKDTVYNDLTPRVDTLEGKVENVEQVEIPRIDNELGLLDGRVGQNENDILDLKTNKADKINTYTQNETNNLLNDKVDKTTTINGKDLSQNRVLESNDIPHNGTNVKADLERLENVKATTSYVDNEIIGHNTENTAHPYLLALIDAIQGAFVYRGNIDETTETIRNDKSLLDTRIDDVYDRASRLGDVLKDNKGVEWYFNGDNWFEYGQGEIGEVSAENDGLMTVALFLKLMALYDKQTLDNLLDSKLNDGLTINGVSYDPIYNRYVLDAVKIIFNNPSKPIIDNKNVEEVILDILNEIDNIEESNEYLLVVDERDNNKSQFRIYIDADGDLAYDLEEEL